MNTKDRRDEEITLELLEAVGKNSRVSQRDLARGMGVALGLANSYLKRCIRKGLIKISEAPANRYLYYLTPKGFAEKSQLTARYLSSSFEFYRTAADSCRAVFERCADNGWTRVALCGVSDLAEIATVRAMELSIEVVGYYDPANNGSRFLNRPVWKDFGQIDSVDGFVITELADPAGRHSDLLGRVEAERVLSPDILRLE